ncbi:hypothetical protein ACHJH3_06150 [Campylobacter sp. MOP7]|uniref:hypothetical protein n=1 Tax=Campylobacter canis TaxID=3378588 RepID=UPI00387E89F0
MAGDTPKKTIFNDYSVSMDFNSHPRKAEFDKKYKELLQVASEIDPDGRMSLSFVSNKELYMGVNRMISNAIFIKHRYTQKAMMSNVDLTTEFSSLVELIQNFNNKVDRRRKLDRTVREKMKGKK